MNQSFYPCRTSPICKVGRFAAMFLYPFAAIVLFLIPVILISGAITAKTHSGTEIAVSLIASAFSFLTAAFMLNMSWKCYRMESRRTAFRQDGFDIQDGRSIMHFTWERIDCIAIIVYAASASRQNYQTQICIFLDTIDNACLRKLRDNYLFGAFNLERFVLLDYELSMIEKLQTKANRDILDLRGKQLAL